MEPTRITVQEVKRRMDQGEQFVFLDDRNPQAWAEATTKLPNAIRVPADDVTASLADIPKERPLITYCT